MTEAQRKASAKYAENNTRHYGIKLNYNTDEDLIRLMDSQENKQGFIKQLLTNFLRRP